MANLSTVEGVRDAYYRGLLTTDEFGQAMYDVGRVEGVREAVANHVQEDEIDEYLRRR